MKKNVVGSRIAEARKKNQCTQETLAEQLHVTRQAVSNWESGKSLPDIETLAKLADTLNVTIESLIYNNEEMSRTVREENWIGRFCLNLAIAIYIIGFLWGIIVGVTDIGPDDAASLVILTRTVPFWIKAFLTGSVFLGLSEIISLLEKGTAS